MLSLFQQSLDKLPKTPAGLGSVSLPSSELALHTKVESCQGDGQRCKCLEKTGRSYQLGTRQGRSGQVWGCEGRGEGKSPVLLLTDNIERINQRVKLIPYTLQGVTDRLRAVQELDAVGVGLIFHWEGPLDMCRIAPARKGCRGFGTRDESRVCLLPITVHPDHNRLIPPLGRVSRLAQKLWFPTFPAPQGYSSIWDPSCSSRKIMSLTVGFQAEHMGLHQTGGCTQLVTSVAITKHPLLQFLFFFFKNAKEI